MLFLPQNLYAFVMRSVTVDNKVASNVDIKKIISYKLGKDLKMKNIAAAIGVLLGIMTFGIVLYYVVEIAKGYYHSDCTDTIMWAQAACDAGGLVNEDFGYAGLLPLGGQLFMMPFVALWGVGLKAQIAGMTIFYICFCAALIIICRAMKFGWGWTGTTFSAVLMFVSSSEKLREIFWEHIIYYSQSVLGIIVGVALALLCLNNWDDDTDEVTSERKKTRENIQIENKRFFKTVLYVALLTLWTVIFTANGAQMTIMYAMPLVGAILLERYFDINKKLLTRSNKRYYLLAGIVIAASLAGLLIGIFIKGDIKVSYADAYSSFSRMSDWSNNALKFFTEYFSLLGVDTNTSIIMYSNKGIVILLRILAGCVLMAVPVIMAFLYRKFEQISYRYMIIVYHITAVVIVAGWIFGRLNAANWRLSPLVAMSAILCVMFAKWIVERKKYMRFSIFVLVPLLAMIIVTASSIFTLDKSTEKNKELNYAIEVIENNGLEYGYATFWNANIMTLLSDSKVKVRNVILSEDGVVKTTYQSNSNWYENAPEYERYFLMMTESEYNKYYDGGSSIEKPYYVIASGGYIILVYNHRIF